jgi:hypothetical protein
VSVEIGGTDAQEELVITKAFECKICSQIIEQGLTLLDLKN